VDRQAGNRRKYIKATLNGNPNGYYRGVSAYCTADHGNDGNGHG